MAYWLDSLTGHRVFTGSNPSEAVLKLFFSIYFTPLNFASVCRKLPFLQCAIIGNVQVNWPKLFQDFSEKFNLNFVMQCVHLIIPHPSIVST